MSSNDFLDVGSKIPSFSMPTDSDGTISNEYLKDRKAVIYFYPKDNTPGCTKQAQDFAELVSEFEKENCLVIGVSKDGVKSHDKFKEKFQLPFPLISDESCELCQKFGVWKEKSMYGKKYMGVERSTFLINEDGEIIKSWRKVSVKGHVEKILENVRNL